MKQEIRNKFNKILIKIICDDPELIIDFLDIGSELKDMVKDQIFYLNDNEFELIFYEYTDKTIEETINEIIENMS